MKNLKSTADVVIEQSKRIKPKELANFEFSNLKLKEQLNYANFLKQPLTLGMFVPCDENGNILEKPILRHSFDVQGEPVIHQQKYDSEYKKYQQAKSKVIFKGFELNQKDIAKLRNIFCLTKDKFQLTFFKNEKDVFLDNLITNQTFEIKTIEDLVPYNLEMV